MNEKKPLKHYFRNKKQISDKAMDKIERGFKNVEQITFGKKIISKKKLMFNSPVDWG